MNTQRQCTSTRPAFVNVTLGDAGLLMYIYSIIADRVIKINRRYCRNHRGCSSFSFQDFSQDFSYFRHRLTYRQAQPPISRAWVIIPPTLSADVTPTT